ncbi:MAG: MFS transporter [Rothia sp. (in: high G+C Gram-positive bacteria)]|uniref:MFS transporter n=1 Tax=Rothia sp. (in: high G+C Gram-positive bacteria) TaxID=1885016 RepID=UPI0026DF3410|nr:MFS transporter [Rothia sp. (in: high G+C Gram-positive bacteria)]MDO5750947.1 MFS transporter [Rothia sp. (in: high G+C Gram-positive bacteria)]
MSQDKHPSTATGAIPLITPGADALASTTIENELGAKRVYTRPASQPGQQGKQEPSAKTKQRIPTGLWVLIAASFMIALGYGLVAPVLPSYARSFDVGVAATTMVVSALALTRLLFAPTSGQLISRYGERPIYTLGMLIVAISSFINAIAWDYWVLLASRAFAGIGSVMFTVSAMGLLVRLSPAHMRGRISGLYATAFMLGNILGPVLGGLLSPFGMRLPFVIYGVALIIAGAIVWFMMPSTAELERERDAMDGTEHAAAGTAETTEPKPVQESMTFKQAMTFGNYRSALVTSFANGWAIFGVQSSLIPLLAASLVLASDPNNIAGGTVLASTAMTAYALGNAITQSLSGSLSDKVGRRILLFIGLLMAAAVTALMGVVHIIWVFITAAVFLGVGAAVMGPSLQAAVSDVIGTQRDGGRVLAIYQMSADLGLILGPLFAGLVADAFGFMPAFMLCSAVLLLASLGWLPWVKPKFDPELAEEGYTGR